MKKSSIIGVLILCFAFWGKAQVRNEIRVPDPEGYRTLKCDFHIHTVFSDGLVWPTVRVDEAYREGLDAIALTEHLEYRPHRQDIIASHNRSYEIAEKTARNNQVILIRGSEITRPMAPGHFNAIFLSDCDALEQKDIDRAAKIVQSSTPAKCIHFLESSGLGPSTTRYDPLVE